MAPPPWRRRGASRLALLRAGTDYGGRARALAEDSMSARHLDPVLGLFALGVGICVAGCSDLTAEHGAEALPTIPQANDAYFQAAAATLAQRGRHLQTRRSRNVILFIGDGLDVATVTASRILAHQDAGGGDQMTPLSFESFPQLALARTYGSNVIVSDSANTATALLTGIKTAIGAVGTASGAPAAACDPARVMSLLELAEQRGLVTGIVTNTRVTHATPAAAYAQAPNRRLELDRQVSSAAAEAGCTDFSRQLVEFDDGNGIDVVLGGGRTTFFPKSRRDEEADGEVEGRFEPSVVRRSERRLLGSLQHGVRSDGRNLVQEWQQRYPQGVYVWNDKQLNALSLDQLPVLGLFEATHMEFEVDREADFGGEPSLSDMTRFAVQRLAAQSEGYFLLVEGGLIDHAHHGNNAARALREALELARAVAVADEITNDDDTLLIVTADHGHTLTLSGYPRRQDPILGLTTMMVGPPRPSFSGRPGLPAYTILNYASGRGARIQRSLLEDATTDINYLQPALNPIPDSVHGGQDVPVYSKGPGSELLGGTVEQNYVFHVMAAALGLLPTQ